MWKDEKLKGRSACKSPPSPTAHAKGTCIFVHFQGSLPRLLVGPGEGGKWWELLGHLNENPNRGVWRPSHFLWSICLSRCLSLSCLVPWSSPCPGFDLPIQPCDVPLAKLPGSSWPWGYSDCQRQGDASQRKGHTPNKAAGPPPFMQDKHSPPAGFFFSSWGVGMGGGIPWASIPRNS